MLIREKAVLMIRENEMTEKDIRKKEDELREYQKKSFAARAAVAVITLAAAGIAGFLGKKAGNK